MAALSDRALDNAAYQAWLLRLAYPNMTAVVVGNVIKAFYGALHPAELVRILRHDGGHPVFPNLPAVEMGRLLRDPFGFRDMDEASMRSVLSDAAYPPADIDAAIAQLFPPRPRTSVLSFDGTGTYVRLSHDTLGGWPDIANTGFTIDAIVYPTALDDRPIVTLVYEHAGGNGPVQWQAGDLAVGLSLYGGRIRVSAFTPEWNAGVPFDPRLVTLTTEAAIPARVWSKITAIWPPGGCVSIHLNERPQRLEIQNNHGGRNSGGLVGCVNTFAPSVHRFHFGRYKSRFFQGHMMDVKLYKGPQDQGQPLFQNLVGHWPLDEGSGNTARDLAAARNHGDIQNAAWARPPA